jgi:hypothetical protein
MNPSFAQAQVQAMHAGDAGYAVLLDAAMVPLRESLDGRVELEVERMDRLGDWAFVLGNMRAPGGGRPDLSGTRFADASEQGAMSDVYVVLLRREPGTTPGAEAGTDPAAWVDRDGPAPGASPAAPAQAAARDQAGLPAASAATAVGSAFPAGGHWQVVDHAIGPGDVAWLDWPAEHAAPRVLFGF